LAIRERSSVSIIALSFPVFPWMENNIINAFYEFCEFLTTSVKSLKTRRSRGGYRPCECCHFTHKVKLSNLHKIGENREIVNTIEKIGTTASVPDMSVP